MDLLRTGVRFLSLYLRCRVGFLGLPMAVRTSRACQVRSMQPYTHTLSRQHLCNEIVHVTMFLYATLLTTKGFHGYKLHTNNSLIQ